VRFEDIEADPNLVPRTARRLILREGSFGTRGFVTAAAPPIVRAVPSAAREIVAALAADLGYGVASAER
jgi:hypothetical protein